MQYQIGDFSRISRLSIKTLRYYHECGLLEPTYIDQESGYRYYDESSLVRVGIINELKELDFSLKDIKDILGSCSDDAGLLDHALKKSLELKEKISRYNNMQKKLDIFIKQTKEAEGVKMLNMNTEILIKDIPKILVASLRFKGKYQDVSSSFSKLFRHCGRYSNGVPLSLYYDRDYKEEDADIEACVPVKSPVETAEIKCRELAGGKALTVIHKGPYETIGESYKILIDHITESGLQVESPSREVYIKGPGLILPRSPKKFITEIQMFLSSYS